MNDPKGRKRILWLAALGVLLLLSLLFVSLFAPSGESAASTPVIRPGAMDRGQEGVAGSSPQGFSVGGGQVISIAWRLGLVAAILGVSIVGLRWWAKRTSGPKSVTGFLRVVDTLAISNGRAVHLVALGARVIAVGATAQQLTFLSELSDDDARDVIARAGQPGQQALAGFAVELFNSMRRPRRTSLPSRDTTVDRSP